VVELNFVTLIPPESEPREGVLGTEGDFPAASVAFALAVRDGLLVDGFNGLDVGFLPDECSAKETVHCKNVVYVYHERRLVDWWTWALTESWIQTPLPNWSLHSSWPAVPVPSSTN
jgi:hypothetical protein